MSRTLGVSAGIAAGICLATGGLALRLIEAAEGWQILVYRGAALAISIFVWMLFAYKRDTMKAFARLGWRGLFAAGVIGVVAVLYVFAILNTTVANTVVILTLSPLITAAVAWLFLKEPVSRSTLVTMLIALVGVAVMFADGLSGEGVFGMVIALGAASCFSLFVVTLRAGREVDMVPAIGLSGVGDCSHLATVCAGFKLKHLGHRDRGVLGRRATGSWIRLHRDCNAPSPSIVGGAAAALGGCVRAAVRLGRHW